MTSHLSVLMPHCHFAAFPEGVSQFPIYLFSTTTPLCFSHKEKGDKKEILSTNSMFLHIYIYMYSCVWTALSMTYLCHKFLRHCTHSLIKTKLDFFHYASNPLPSQTSYTFRMSYVKIYKLKFKVPQQTDRHKIKSWSFPGAPPCGYKETEILPETTIGPQ